MKPSHAAVIALVALGLVGGGAFLISHRDNAPAPHVSEPASKKPVAAAPAPAEEPIIIARHAMPAEKDSPELKYLPDNIEIAQREVNGMLRNSKIAEGARKLSAVRAVSTPDKNGEFLSPRFSPDGLQMIVSRPGYQGVYVMGINGGTPVKISDGNGFKARWTADGRIEIPDDAGNSQIFGSDGTLEESRPTQSNQQVFAKDDAIYTAEAGGAPIPLTGSDDRYFNPVTSPDGTQVVFQGLYSGLYMAPADGSGEPVYIGPGNNPQWAPDGSGVVYDVTYDDGHNLLEGDIYYVDANLGERSNLTEGDGLIGQLPVIGPDGTTVLFESEGGIYLGSLQ